MKKQFILMMVTAVSMLMATSCNFLEDYLDKAPESGLQEKEVFSKYANFRLYFDAVYNGRRYYNNGWRDTWNYKSCCPFYIDEWDQKYCFNSTTDMCDQGRYMEGHAWKSGNMSETIIAKLCYDGSRRPILGACYDDIRICNKAIRNIDMVQDFQDATVMNDFLGQAYFMRGFYHWTLFRLWGPMPYMDVLLTLEDSPWDYERMGKNEFVDRIIQDWDSAYYYFNLAGKIRRDPGTLQYGTYEMHRPNGMACKSYKARALLYAASPLNNKNGMTDWEEAAAAAWEAIQLAEANGVRILPLTDASNNDRHLNYYGADVCEESIWTYSHGSRNWNFTATLWGGHFMSSTSASGIFPTQNWVDRYETRWGDPLVTQADRDAATALGHYNEQQPFKDRDPRFYKDIIYNGSPAPGWGGGSEGASNTAWMYYNGTTPTTLLNTSYPGRSYTGYALRKLWNNNSTKNQSTTTIYSDPLSRLSELYLNYAEAVNEAYGPAGTAPTCPMNAWDAIDVIRLKSGMPVIDRVKYSTKDLLRPRIKNERCIELSFEGQFYYDDVRRWMDLPQVMGSKLIGNLPQKTTVSATYPDGFIYSRTLLPPDRQPAWEEGMYYLYFLNSDGLKMKKFKNNPAW